MDLPLTYEYQGWSIRYGIAVSNTASASSQKEIVFVHGTPWSSAVFRPIVEALLAKGSYRILVYDLPGYGQSQQFQSGPNPPSNDFVGDTSVNFQSKALTNLLKHVKFDYQADKPAPAVIAHDIAGTIVLRAHLWYGCAFASMMLVDTNVVLPWGDGFYKLVRTDPRPFLQLPPKIFEAIVRAVIQSACHNPKVLEAGWEDLLARPWLSPEGQRSFVRQIAQANDKDVAELMEGDRYKHVECNVKVIWGVQDEWIPKAKIEEMIQRMDGRVVETAFISEAGHLVMLDQPARFAIEVFDWLARSV